VRRCRYCREYNIPKSAPKEDAFCTHEHKVAYAMDVVNRSRQKQAKLVKKEDVRRKKEFYEKDYRHQFKLTLEAAKKLCRLLDAGKPCISCGTGADIQYAAGHYKSAGAHPELALDLRNLHRQCNRYCNCGLSGNIAGNKNSAGYRSGLVARYGQGLLDYLDGYHVPRKSTCGELMVFRATLNAEIRRLEAGLPPSKDWRALPQAQEQAAA
jgi:hypothetical protein